MRRWPPYGGPRRLGHVHGDDIADAVGAMVRGQRTILLGFDQALRVDGLGGQQGTQQQDNHLPTHRSPPLPGR